jgi:hypothetical protein
VLSKDMAQWDKTNPRELRPRVAKPRRQQRPAARR